MLGDYARTSEPELLLQRRSDGPRNDVARLEGARMIITSETPDGAALNESLVKRITGGDTLASRKLYHEYAEFRSSGKPWLSTNKKPQIRGREIAIWERILMVPFNVTIPDNEQDKDLLQKLRAELLGILAWAVRSCLEWQKIGLCPPPEVLAATKEMNRNQIHSKNSLKIVALRKRL
jgi:putative DNA primase/helicase